jgi:very-long-chain enoyl-CoA reductase
MVKVTSRSKSIKATQADPKTYDDLIQFIAKENKLNSNRLRVTTLDKKIITTTADLLSQDEILVKDLGPQIGWRTVYIIEYLGPLLLHILMYHYAGQPKEYELLYKMQVFHYSKREFENVFVHKFSSSTMPLFNLFKNSGYYWGLGSSLALTYAGIGNFTIPNWNPSKETITYLFYGWCVCQFFNGVTHIQLRLLGDKSIRMGKGRQIPKGGFFELFISPNYTFEIYGWALIFLMNPNVFSLGFLCVGATQMYVWAQGKNRKYASKRAFLIPFLF